MVWVYSYFLVKGIARRDGLFTDVWTPGSEALGARSFTNLLAPRLSIQEFWFLNSESTGS